MGYRTKVCLNGSGHMAKLAVMTIYDKNPSRIFLYGTRRPIALKLGM